MKTFSIETHEMYKCRYIVDADSADEAIVKFKDGEADEAAPLEYLYLEGITDAVEIDDDEDSD